MKQQAKVYISAVILCGMALLAVEFVVSSWPAPLKFFFYLTVALVTSGLKVALPGIDCTMSVNLVVILISLVELSPGEALAVGCASALFQSIWHQRRIELVHVAFNLAQISISMCLSSLVFRHSALVLGPSLPLRLMATAIAYFLTNTILVAVVVALTEKRSFQTTWSDCYFWSFPNYLVGAALAWAITWSNANLGWQASALMVPVAYLMYRSCRLYLGRLEDEKKHGEQMAELHLRTVEALALAIDAKDHTTHDHLQRVRIFALEVGKEMGLTDSELEALRAAALLHDIGKLAVPEHIINKPGRLSPEEFEKMKIHPIVGGEILERVNFPYPVVPIVRSHHEKWDGSGYPDGLKGEQIPVGARVLSAVDCLDALVSDRQYRRGIPLDDAMNEIVRLAGTQFDPRVVEVLQRTYHELEHKAQAASGTTDLAKLSTDVKVINGAAPAVGFEKAKLKTTTKVDFMASIVAARHEAQTLLEFSREVGRSLSLYETLSLVAARLRKLIPYNSVAIYLIRDGKLVPEYVTGDDFRIFSSLEIPLGEGLSGWVAQNSKPILNGNPSVEPGYLNEVNGGTCMSSALAVPLMRGEQDVLGVLALYKMEADGFTADHLRVLLAMTEKIGASIDNAIQYQAAADSAKIDFLTGLPNARSLFHHLQGEVARCARENRSLAVIMCDLDGFKSFNDKFGHLAGNSLLEVFAGKLRVVCREYDFVSRMGGDEFVLVFPGLSRKLVREICQRVNSAAVESAMEVCPSASLSASVGVAFYPEDATDAEQMLGEADKRMYSCKKGNKPTETFPDLPVATLMMQ